MSKWQKFVFERLPFLFGVTQSIKCVHSFQLGGDYKITMSFFETKSQQSYWKSSEFWRGTCCSIDILIQYCREHAGNQMTHLWFPSKYLSNKLNLYLLSFHYLKAIINNIRIAKAHKERMLVFPVHFVYTEISMQYRVACPQIGSR